MATEVCRPNDRLEEENNVGVADLGVDPMLSETRAIDRPVLPKLDDFKKAIPAHCFKRDTLQSMYFFAKDYAILIALYLTVPYFEAVGGLFGLFVWYVLMGIYGFALFVIGHDCLHASFSENELVNDVVGHLTFAPLLTPYWPWQISHKTHHAFTNHVEKDHGHPWITQHRFFTRPMILYYMTAFPLSGWLKWHPLYLFLGQPDGSHFWPFSSLFPTVKDQLKCVASCTAIVFCAWVAFKLCGSDWFTYFKYFLVPECFFGCMLVLCTYLNHMEEYTEVYEPDEWSWLRGQSQTVDRTYGFGIDYAVHHLSNGHYTHHLFNKMPHYHLMEATEAVKKVLEPFKGTQYAYKHQSTRDWFFRFLDYNVRLDYLVPKAKGIWQFRSAVKNN